ncbi:MAG: beta-N-acetylhexosaminidase [Nitrospinae bacterium]|nr:beta-N-acetylhexosaminidase [Nitrospinota bacterium]
MFDHLNATTFSHQQQPGDFTSARAAGQLLILGFDGTKYTPAMGSWFKEFKPGGVILFARNMEEPGQIKRLVSDIVKLSEDVTGMIPFVCVDQEGGRVSRLPVKHYPEFPTARALAMDGSEERVRENYREIGNILHGLGFNVDFAPVADLDTNPGNPIIGDRSFGSDPDKVSRFVAASIRGLKDAGILSCAKHFPGHGDTSLDSHLDLPEDQRPAQRFYDAELAPFAAAAAEGVDFFMTAHVVYPAFDPRNPATLSEIIIQGIARDRIGYDGIIAGDDMDMKAIAGRWGDGQAARMALQAGVDMLLVCHETPRRRTVFNAVLEAVESGLVDGPKVHERLERIIKAKNKILSIGGNNA